ELAPTHRDVAQVLQRQQVAAHDGARQAGAPGYLGQRSLRQRVVEGAQDLEAARERLHVVRAFVESWRLRQAASPAFDRGSLGGFQYVRNKNLCSVIAQADMAGEWGSDAGRRTRNRIAQLVRAI